MASPADRSRPGGNGQPSSVLIPPADQMAMGPGNASPPGGISHVHFEKDGCAHGVDVFDSVELYQEFVQSRLIPAMGKVAAAEGLDVSKLGEPEVTITEVHRVVH
jgi:hypothetical protein